MNKGYTNYWSKLKKQLRKAYYKRLFKKDGINLVGYFSIVASVAEVSRFFIAKLRESEITLPYSLYNIMSYSHAELNPDELKKYSPLFIKKPPYWASIVFVNADAVPIMTKFHPHTFKQHYNIGVFWWEFNDYFFFPETFEYIHEVVVFSDFIATAIRKDAPPDVRVSTLPFPFVPNWKITTAPVQMRERYGIDKNEFVFFFNFDFTSILERKNPGGLIKAFGQAFTNQTDVRLVIKTIYSGVVLDKFQEFMLVVEALDNKDRILIINENLTRNEMTSLINAADVYVSLHRSEGLGLGMLEAMSLGKPVIGTGFGGNMEFMNKDVAFVVDYKLVPLEKDALPYRKGWLWAEPDTEQAAGYMKTLYDDRALAKAIGTKAQNFIQERYSAPNFTKAVHEWLTNRPQKIVDLNQ